MRADAGEELRRQGSSDHVGHEDFRVPKAALRAVELLLALEDVFGIEIADEELSQDAFSSPRTLAVLVQQAQQRAAASKP